MNKHHVTIEEIARELGCSVTTVSRAISGKGRVSHEMRIRVLECCRKYNYRTDQLAEEINQLRTYNLAAVLPADKELDKIPFFQTCLLGICDFAEEKGYHVLAVTSGSQDKVDASQLHNIVRNHKADGVIILRALVQDRAVEYLLHQKIPFVQIGNKKNASVISVDHDSFRACRDMTIYLLEKKIQRIALIGGDKENIVTRNRLDGFRAGFASMQKTPKDEWIYQDCNTDVRVYEAVEQIVEDYAECIVCMDDKICGQVLRKLNQMRIAVPRDMKVVSFYDSLMLQNYMLSVTAIHFDDRELGRTACEKLIRLLEGKAEKSVLLPEYELKLRESTKEWKKGK